MNAKLRDLKNKFLAWAIQWANIDENVEDTSFDLPEIVNILQALGFQLRDIDNCDSKDVSLRNGERGLKIVVTCAHSGQICHLEKPTEEKSCKCIQVTDNNGKDGFWEVSATKPSDNKSGTILETGSNLIPSLSKELIVLVNGIASHIFQMMTNEKCVESPQSLDKLYLASPRNTVKSRSFDNTPNDLVTSPIQSSSKPVRYGSLDAIPSTFSITKKETISEKHVTEVSLTSSYQAESCCSTKDFDLDASDFPKLRQCYPLIERAHSDLEKVLTFLRCNMEETYSICDITELIEEKKELLKAATSKNPSTEQPLKILSKSKTSVVVPRVAQFKPRTTSSPGLINISSKLKPQTKLTTKPETLKTKPKETIRSAKVIPDIKMKDTPTRSTKYAHIKSTIPKATPLKKK